jgi:hypothetical protein
MFSLENITWFYSVLVVTWILLFFTKWVESPPVTPTKQEQVPPSQPQPIPEPPAPTSQSEPTWNVKPFFPHDDHKSL